jgi:hypothetical protein
MSNKFPSSSELLQDPQGLTGTLTPLLSKLENSHAEGTINSVISLIVTIHGVKQYLLQTKCPHNLLFSSPTQPSPLLPSS